MNCKGCKIKYDGSGYWVCLTTPHDPTYTLCPDCNRGYKDVTKPLPPKNLVERFQQMKEEANKL
tara:strand:- start:29 stop:220 length:192 start_codon:yes stop_codon:yes gene_type:complete